MILRVKILLCLILPSFLHCCVESFDSDIDKYEDLLVIEGMISNLH